MPTYVNPFGSWSQGYGQGVNQEIALQQGARAARNSDFDFNFMQPEQLNHLQLANQYDTQTMPDRVRGAKFGADVLGSRAADAAFSTADRFAQRTGSPNPYINAVDRYFGLHMVPTAGGFNITDAAGNTVANPTNERFASDLDQQRTRENVALAIQLGQLDNGADTAQARQMSAWAAQYRATHPGGGAAGAPATFAERVSPFQAPQQAQGAPQAPAVTPGATPAAPEPAPAGGFNPDELDVMGQLHTRFPNLAQESPELQAQAVSGVAQQLGISEEQALQLIANFYSIPDAGVQAPALSMPDATTLYTPTDQ